MKKVLNFKETIDSKLLDNSLLILGVYVGMLVIHRIIGLIVSMFEIGVVFVIVDIIFIGFQILMWLVIIYFLYLLFIKKQLIPNLNKYVVFVLSSFIVYVLTNAILTVLNGNSIFYDEFIGNQIKGFIAIPNILTNIKSVFLYLSWTFESFSIGGFGSYGYIYLLLALLSVFAVIKAPIVLVATIFFILYDLKFEKQLLKSSVINIGEADQEAKASSFNNVEQVNIEESKEESDIANSNTNDVVSTLVNEDNKYISSQMVDMYIMTNKKYFGQEKVLLIRDKLSKMNEEQYLLVSTVELKDPTIMLIVSIFVGSLGIDRFMLGDTGMGVLKLLTGGCCGVLTIIDWFTISKKVKDLNFKKIMSI